MANKIKEWKLNYALQVKVIFRKKIDHLVCFYSMRVVVAHGLVNCGLVTQLKD